MYPHLGHSPSTLLVSWSSDGGLALTLNATSLVSGKYVFEKRSRSISGNINSDSMRGTSNSNSFMNSNSPPYDISPNADDEASTFSAASLRLEASTQNTGRGGMT